MTTDYDKITLEKNIRNLVNDINNGVDSLSIVEGIVVMEYCADSRIRKALARQFGRLLLSEMDGMHIFVRKALKRTAETDASPDVRQEALKAHKQVAWKTMVKGIMHNNDEMKKMAVEKTVKCMEQKRTGKPSAKVFNL